MLQRRSPLKRSPLARSYTWKKRTVRFTGPMPDVVQAVLERDQHRCVVCAHELHGQRGVDWALHHRRPRRMGGDPRSETNMPANLVAVCTPCHLWLESRRAEALELGLLLHTNDDPRDHPVAHAVLGSVLLTDDGGVWPVGGEAA